jgi:hypothetical protein
MKHELQELQRENEHLRVVPGRRTEERNGLPSEFALKSEIEKLRNELQAKERSIKHLESELLSEQERKSQALSTY